MARAFAAFILIALMALPASVPSAGASHNSDGQPLTMPTITSVVPATASRGDRVDVYGSNFTGMSAPNLDRAYSDEYGILSDTHFQFRIPPRTPTGQHTFYMTKNDMWTGQSVEGSYCCVTVVPARALFVTTMATSDPFFTAFADAGYDVTAASSIPQDLSAYHLVVLQSYDAAQPSALPRLQSYVAEGGGLILTAGTPIFLCGSRDLSCLGWFGSNAAYVNSGGRAYTLGYAFNEPAVPGQTTLVASTPNYYSQAAVVNTNQTPQARWDYDGADYGVSGRVGRGYVSFLADVFDTAGAKHAYNVAALRYNMGRSTGVPALPPSAPVLSAVAGVREIALSWAAPADGGSPLTGYQLERQGAPLASLNAMNTSFIDATLGNGVTASYALKAVNANGASPASGLATATTHTTPTAPTALAATPGVRQVSLTWEAPASNGGSAVAGYRIFRMDLPSGPLLAEIGANTSFVDATAPPGRNLCYSVRAITAVGEGPLADGTCATTFTVPWAPDMLRATPGARQVSLDWRAPFDGGSPVTGYRIYRENVLLASIGTNTSFIDATLGENETTHYSFTAMNAVGESFPGGTIPVTTFGPLVRIDLVGPVDVIAGTTNTYALHGRDERQNELPLAASLLVHVASAALGPETVCYEERGILGCIETYVHAAELARIDIEGPDTVRAGESAYYSLFGWDAYGNPVSLPDDGMDRWFGERAGMQSFVYWDRGVMGHKEVLVTPAALRSIEIVGPAEIVAGSTSTYTLSGFDRYLNEVVLSMPTVEFKAPTVVGMASVSHVEDGIAGQFDVMVVADVLARIVVTGPDAIMAGSQATYGLAGQDRYGNPLPLGITELTYFAPTLAGEYLVSYDELGIAGHKAIRVTPGPLSAISIEAPAQVWAGYTVDLGLVGSDGYGNPVELAHPTQSWTAPYAPGSYEVTYTREGISVSATIASVLPPVTAITVEPDQESTNVGRVVEMRATAIDENGRGIPYAPIAWSTSMGTITDDGRFIADKAGDAIIVATSGDVEGRGLMTVTDRLSIGVTFTKSQIGVSSGIVSGEVVVRFDDLTPVGGATVTVEIDSTSAPALGFGRSVSGQTNETGVFRFTLVTAVSPPGSYDFVASAGWRGNAGSETRTLTQEPLVELP